MSMLFAYSSMLNCRRSCPRRKGHIRPSLATYSSVSRLVVCVSICLFVCLFFFFFFLFFCMYVCMYMYIIDGLHTYLAMDVETVLEDGEDADDFLAVDVQFRPLPRSHTYSNLYIAIKNRMVK